MRPRIDWRWAALTAWPGAPTPAHQRTAAPFRATWEKTKADLDRELHHLGARDVLLEADCDESQVRLDGQLRANAKLRGPGIVVSCRVGGDFMRYPCDKFKHWDDNARAIAKTLEALRAVDRYGVTANRQQYAGFRALPSSGSPSGVTTRIAHIAVLRQFSGMYVPDDATEATLLMAFRAARRRTHTDIGGRREDWDAVEEAARALGLL